MKLDIAAYRLHNQHLLQRDFTQPADVVRWLGAVQAQDYAGAKWALGLRIDGLIDPIVDQAFAAGSILRTHILRPTWHFVTPADIRWMLKLTGPRVHAVNATINRQFDVDQATIRKSYRVMEKSLRDHHYLKREEIASALEAAGIQAEGVRLAYIVMSAELDALICSGPRKGKQFTYALLEERALKVPELTREESLAELVKRYFQSHAPATLHDFCVWSGLTLADAKNGIEMVKSNFVSENIDGQIYWFPEIGSIKLKSPTAHLLPNYDEYFIGFKDRSAISQAVRGQKIDQNDPAFLAHILILDGQVIGGWKRTLKKDEVLIEITLLVKLSQSQKRAVQKAAELFGTFLQLPISLSYKEFDSEQRTSRSF
jgi:hypothetical protein